MAEIVIILDDTTTYSSFYIIITFLIIYQGRAMYQEMSIEEVSEYEEM